MSIHRAMGSVAAVTAFALTTLAAPSFAGQIMSTEVQMMNYQFPLSPGSQMLTFNQFDDQGGTRELLSVKIESTTTIQAQVTIENLSVLEAPDAAINLIGTQTLTFPNPGGLPILTIIGPAVFQTGGLDPSDGNPGSGPDFFDFGLVSDSSMNMDTLTAPGDNLAAFIGLATLDAFVNANGGFSTSGSTDSTLMFSEFMAVGEVTITYTFVAELGACCLAGGACMDLTEFDCTTMGGVYQGDLTTCATTTCLNGVIGDFVWSDLNGNGIQDGGEPGIAGVTVNLLDAGMIQIDTTMTDGAGAYMFTGLDAGDYTVQFVNPNPATLVESPASQGVDPALDSNCIGGLAAVTLPTPNTTDLTIDCGFVTLAGQIGDFVWSDTNGNGLQDGGEPGIAGVIVNLLDAGMVLIDSTATNGAGAYLFTGLDAGDYTVQFVNPGGFVESPANQGVNDAIDSDCVGGLAPVTLASPVEVNLTIDCGLIPFSGQIGDFIWSDTNGNGIQDGGEPGIAGVTVKLLDAALIQIDMMMTDGAGGYLFSGLPAGDYTVMVVAPAGFMESPAGQGGNPAVDSNCVGGMAPVTLPTALSVDLTIDCGLIPPLGKIGDFIFEDLNGNGIQDGGEPGIGGVTVKLLDVGLVQIATTVTDGTGMYMFGGLTAGTYTVMIDGTTVPPGYTESPPNVGGDDNIDSDCIGGMVLVVLPSNTTIDNSVDCGLVPPGACCFDDGTCAVLSSDDCNAANGIPQGPATTCATVICPAPACCFPDGTCQELIASDCIAAGGAPQGAGTNCTPNLCPPPLGACCLDDGSCVNVTAAACAGLGGAYQGDLTLCVNVVCPAPGACCLPDGTCRQELVLGGAQCLADGGTYQGDNSLCLNVVCPFGACCVGPNCIEISPAGCAAQGGLYQGDGTMCVNIDCAPMTPMRGNCSQKGSLLIFSKVELRWGATNNVTQDTFIQITNDFPDDVKVQMYFINGDPPLAATANERAHPGWNWVDNLIMLTGDQTVAWSALTGSPGGIGVSPFATALDPGFPPGRPCPDGSGDRCMRGFIVAWAVDDTNNGQIRWDHLAGEATLVNYDGSYAWQYSACAYQVVDPLVAHGGPVGMAGMINLDGVEYEAVYDLLLLQFQAANAGAFGGPIGVLSDGDLTLHAVSGDFRQETDGPITTKASFEVWNMNELKFSGMHRCITCWDQTLFSQYTDNGPANHLLLANLQTNHGKARIDGLQSQLCDEDFDPNNNVDFPFPPGPGDATDPRDVVSQAAALTGLRATFLRFGAANAINAAAGGNLVGMGFQTAAIKYDPVDAPPSNPTEEEGRTPNTDPAEADGAFDSLLLEAAPSAATSSGQKR